MQAKEVKGCTDVRRDPWAAQAWSGPVEGTGAHTGKVKNFGTKGYGFITMEVRQQLLLRMFILQRELCFTKASC